MFFIGFCIGEVSPVLCKVGCYCGRIMTVVDVAGADAFGDEDEGLESIEAAEVDDIDATQMKLIFIRSDLFWESKL